MSVCEAERYAGMFVSRFFVETHFHGAAEREKVFQTRHGLPPPSLPPNHPSYFFLFPASTPKLPIKLILQNGKTTSAKSKGMNIDLSVTRLSSNLALLLPDLLLFLPPSLPPYSCSCSC